MARLLRALALALLAACLAAPALQAATPAEDLSALNARVTAALQQLDAGNVAGAQAEFKAFNDGWFVIEDGIRAQDRAAYRSIEEHMTDVQAAFASGDAARIRAELQAQNAVDQDFIQRYSGATTPASAAPRSAPADASTGMAALVKRLDAA